MQMKMIPMITMSALLSIPAFAQEQGLNFSCRHIGNSKFSGTTEFGTGLFKGGEGSKRFLVRAFLYDVRHDRSLPGHIEKVASAEAALEACKQALIVCESEPEFCEAVER